MAFLRRATLDIKSVYATDASGKFQWRDFVKQANENPSNDRTKFLPQEAYNYDTKNFLFLTARAISGMEKHGYNGNFDAFPWEEIKKALPTYPGVGFYIEHKEDSEADAKGIVLDAVPNDEEEYVVCLCAIDKNEYPEFCQQILDGTYNQVSMSCLASTCICSKCGNVATSFDNLCEHMNPNNPITYMKGKQDENGNYVYEINKDICFTGLSAVEVPADKDAFVFDIKASKKKSNVKEEFNKYMAIKQAGKMKEFKMACEEQFKALSNVDLLNKMKTLADTITTTIMGNDNANIITSPLQGIVKELMQLQIGLNMMDLQKLENQTKEQPIEQENDIKECCKECKKEVKDIEEVNLDKEINSMFKQANEFTLNKNQKMYLLDNLFIDGDAYDDYKKAMNAEWKVTINDTKDKQEKDSFPYSLFINNRFADAIGSNIVNKLQKLDNEVNLDKEIDSYLDGDNYSYTPFSSTASLDKIIEKTYK